MSTVKEFTDTLHIYHGSLYVNDLNLFGRTWQVNVQAEPQFRDGRKRSAAKGPQRARATWCRWGRWRR